MSKRIATWLFTKLSVEREGAVRPPGAGIAREWTERDGRKLLIVSHGDAFDVYHGRRDPIVFSISPTILLSLGIWILWSWWFGRIWCGVKVRLWLWALERLAAPDGDKTPVKG